MLIDGRTIPSDQEIRTDVCIVGAGAAGITLAHEFVGAPFEVVLLEGGGLEADPETQSLYKGRNTGFPYFDLDVSRLRFFGGTTNHWAGACGPLAEIEFEARPWCPRSGWPFPRTELEPFQPRAERLCEISHRGYEAADWATAAHGPLPLDPRRVVTRMVQYSPPTQFGRVYRARIEQSSNVRACLFSNAVEIEASDNARSVTGMRVARLGGSGFRVAARLIILAAGAIENARLLLASDRTQPGGLGNASDLVGGCFMEHLRVGGAILLPSDPHRSLDLYLGQVLHGLPVSGYLALPAEALRREEILSVRAHLYPQSVRQGLRDVSPALVEAQVAYESGLLFDEFGHHLFNVIRGLDDVAIYGYEHFFGGEGDVRAFGVVNHVEQAPEPGSRVRLSSETDALGMRRVELHWRFGELERRSLQRTNELLALELGRSGVGRLRIVPSEPTTGWPPGVRGNWHQMGTTRMHLDPRQGVVDRHCRVHGLANLYVAGASVFPICGYNNPTLTIVALAVRLADRVKGLAARGFLPS